MNKIVFYGDKGDYKRLNDFDRQVVINRIMQSKNSLKMALNGDKITDEECKGLKPDAIVLLLQKRPELINKVDFNSLRLCHLDKLLKNDEKYLEIIDWHEINRHFVSCYGNDASIQTLVKNPNYLQYFPQPDLIDEEVKVDILLHNPQSRKYFNLKMIGIYLPELLVKQPQLHKYCNLSKLTNVDAVNVLNKHRYLLDYIPLSNFKNDDYFWKMSGLPEYKKTWLIISKKKKIYDNKEKKFFKFKQASKKTS